MNGQAANAAIGRLLDFAGVQAGPDLEAELAHGAGDRESAAGRTSRPVKGRQEAISGGAHLMAAVARELLADDGVMGMKQLAPGLVAQLGGALCGSHDVCKENGRQDPVGLGLVPDAG